jgi:hypothetical protein
MLEVALAPPFLRKSLFATLISIVMPLFFVYDQFFLENVLGFGAFFLQSYISRRSLSWIEKASTWT